MLVRQTSVVTGVLLTVCLARAYAQAGPPNSLVPLDPITVVADALKTHDIVALPDAHGNAEAHAFRLRLLQDDRVLSIIDDVVIELGNARHQSVADDYVQGKLVPDTVLRRIWQDTTVATGGNNYEMMQELLAVIRSVNAERRKQRPLRVLLGDPPIDWERVQVRPDHQKYLALRDSHPAAVIVAEVLAKQRKALLMYGALHFQRRNIMGNYALGAWQTQTIVSILESTSPAKIFTIWEDEGVLQDTGRAWPVPSAALTRGTTVGASDFATFVGKALSTQRVTVNGDSFVPVPERDYRRMAVEEQIDAILYLGPRTPTRPAHEIPRAMCEDEAFVREQVRRILLAAPRFEAERLRDYCAGVSPRVQ